MISSALSLGRQENRMILTREGSTISTGIRRVQTGSAVDKQGEPFRPSCQEWLENHRRLRRTGMRIRPNITSPRSSNADDGRASTHCGYDGLGGYLVCDRIWRICSSIEVDNEQHHRNHSESTKSIVIDSTCMLDTSMKRRTSE